MYLSKFEINRDHPSARQALCNVQDFHRNLMARFDTTRQQSGVLYRMDLSKKCPVVYVLSKVPPKDMARKDMKLVGVQQIDSMLQNITKNQRFSFDVCAIPSKKVQREGKKNSRRITLHSENERLEWMQKKARQGGFQITTIQEINAVNSFGSHGNSSMQLCGYHYQGQLIVEEPEKFRQTYCEGIGPDKAYGFGMLLLL